MNGKNGKKKRRQKSSGAIFRKKLYKEKKEPDRADIIQEVKKVECPGRRRKLICHHWRPKRHGPVIERGCSTAVRPRTAEKDPRRVPERFDVGIIPYHPFVIEDKPILQGIAVEQKDEYSKKTKGEIGFLSESKIIKFFNKLLHPTENILSTYELLSSR